MLTLLSVFFSCIVKEDSMERNRILKEIGNFYSDSLADAPMALCAEKDRFRVVGPFMMHLIF